MLIFVVRLTYHFPISMRDFRYRRVTNCFSRVLCACTRHSMYEYTVATETVTIAKLVLHPQTGLTASRSRMRTQRVQHPRILFAERKDLMFIFGWAEAIVPLLLGRFHTRFHSWTSFWNFPSKLPVRLNCSPRRIVVIDSKDSDTGSYLRDGRERSHAVSAAAAVQTH